MHTENVEQSSEETVRHLLSKSMGETWSDKGLIDKYFNKVRDKLILKSAHKVIYPSRDDIFRAYKLTPLSDIKVVILGQD